MPYDWRRPDNVTFPQVWHKFQAKDLNSDELVEYRVEDLTPDRFDDAIEQMSDYLRDEPMCCSKNILADSAATIAFKNLWKSFMDLQKVTLVCYREGSDEIVGVNMLAIYTKYDVKDEKKFVSQVWLDMGNAVNYILDQCNVYEKYSTDATMFGWGLSVSNKFRGRGIANEILKARIPFCKAIGVKLSTTIFTNRISQKCAESVGFKDDYAIAYDELVKIDSGWDFRKTPTKVCKMKSLCID